MWQRARTDEQRAQRIESILSAAAELFESTAYEAVTLQAIATRAGFTRSNLYRYFQTREEIFLELYRGDLDAWLSALESALAGLSVAGFNDSPPAADGDRCTAGASVGSSPTASAIDAFAELWTNVLLEQERMLRLSALLTISLEKNSSESLYRSFKEFTSDLMERAAALIMPGLRGFSREEIYRFFLVHQALVSGGAPMSRYTEMQSRVLDTPDLRHLRVEFGPLYRDTIAAYLMGRQRTG